MSSQLPHQQQQDQPGGISTATATGPPVATSALEAAVSNLSLEAAAASRQAKGKSAGAGHQNQEQQPTTGSSSQNVKAMQNRAGQSNSPYVQSHASSPVKWQLLDDEAVDRARRENKLIFLNVGFKACHYCRLMTEESFSHPFVSDLLNASFVPIIVDREERPDIDAIYMNYIQAIQGMGGWPLNVFLTSDLEPVFGGTYWPAPGTQGDREDEEDETLDFAKVLQKMEGVWREQEGRCRKEAGEILLRLREFAAEGTLGTSSIPRTTDTATLAIDSGAGAGGMASAALARSMPVPSLMNAADGGGAAGQGLDTDLDLDQLDEAQTHIANTFDPVHGGFSRVAGNRFPVPPKLSFLLRLSSFGTEVADVVGEKDVKHAKDMALITLRRMKDGGLRDQVGAGFHRYSATADWGTPHYEKLVPDNALLMGVYLDAWLQLSGGPESGAALKKEDEFADVVMQLADYLTSRPIVTQEGGFATSEAADSFFRSGDEHVREGAYYLWTRREFDSVVGDASTSAVAAAHWNVFEDGNIPRDLDPHDEFINQNVLRVAKNVEELGRQFGYPVEDVRKMIASAKEKLLAHREKERVRPETDDKVVAAYNGIVISALARTGQAISLVDPERAERCLSTALKAARFIKENLWDTEQKVLYRSFYKTRSSVRGFADDYAFLIEGLLNLTEATGETELLAWAEDLQLAQLNLFYDAPSSKPPTPLLHHTSSGGFYSTEESAPFAILRLKDGMDSAQPSTNAVSSSNLFRLATLLNDVRYTAFAKETLTAFEVEILQYPWLFVGLLASVVPARLGTDGLFIVEKEDKDGQLKRRLSTLPRGAPRAVLKLRVAEDVGSSDRLAWLVERNAALKEMLREKNLEPGLYRWREREGDYKLST